MTSLNLLIKTYQTELQKGEIKKAYKILMEYMMSLRTKLKNKYPDYTISGSLYYGYMDMTYFSFTPPFLKAKNLKIAIVLIHENIQFEIWLGGYNRKIQNLYQSFFKAQHWNKYQMPSSKENPDAILEHCLVKNPDFDNLEALSFQIEQESLNFIKEIKQFFLNHPINKSV